MSYIAKDRNGFPILLADGDEVAAVDPAPAADPPAPDPGNAPAPEVPEDETVRRSDAVRDAAREYDEMEAGDAKEFLAGRAKDLSKVDVAEFVADVKRQRVADVCDILDDSLRRSSEGMLTKRRRVRLKAPGRWVDRALNQMSDDDIAAVAHRLVSRGHEPAEVVSSVGKRIRSADRRQAFEEAAGVGGD